MKLFYSNH